MINITFTAVLATAGGKRRKMNYIPFSLGTGGTTSKTTGRRTRKHKVRKTSSSSTTSSASSSLTAHLSTTTFTMGKRSYSSLFEVDPFETFATFDPSLPPQFEPTNSNKRMKFTIEEPVFQFDSFGDDADDDDETTLLPTPTPTPAPSTTTMGSVMINNVRRSARILNSTVPTMGSIMVDGLRRSARLMSS